MEVDTSALFSMLFIANDTFTDYDKDELVTLNYTFMGNTEMATYQGVWTDVTVNITANSTDPNSKTYSADLTIFVAITGTE